MNAIDTTRVTAEVMPSDPSILSLFRQWNAEYERINRKGSGFTSEQVAELCKPHTAMMNQICSLDSRSPLGVLAKVVAASYRMEAAIDEGWRDSIRDEALAMLVAATDDAVGIGPVFSGMLKASEDTRTAIDEFDGDDFSDPVLKALCERRCELALAICGYRTQSDIEARRKVEFLRDWTECDPLTEEEQNALFASMMPEGGAA